MKLMYAPAALLLTGIIASCSKNNSVSNIANQGTNTAQNKPADITQVSITTSYPYTDTFVGTMVTYLVWGYEGQFHDTDNSCKFMVTHLDSQHCVIRATKPIPVEQYAGVVIDDAYTITGAATDSCNIYIPFGDHPSTAKNALHFNITANVLTASWDIIVPIVGVCDQDESKAQYTGALVKKQR